MSNNTQKMFAGLVPLLSVSVLLCSGCGGGGGGSSGGFVSGPVAVTSANARKVAADSTQVGGALGGTSSGSGGGAAPASAHTATPDASVWRALELQVNRINGSSPPARSLPGMVTAQGLRTTFSCTSNGGTTGNYVIDETSSTSETITYTNCFDSVSGDTLNGALSVSGISFDGATFTGHMSTGNFTVIDATHTYVLSGSADISDVTQTTTDTFTMTGGPLTITVDGASNTLSSFTIVFTEDLSVSRYTTSIDGTMDSQALGGHVTLDTTVPFVSANIDGDNPSAGSMLITGANNSSVRVTALGGDDVRLEVDADGIGGVDPDGTSPAKWSELEALTP